MTPNTDTAEVAPVAAAVDIAAEMLRDVAHVLKLTRRVKAEISAESAPGKTVLNRTWERVLEA